MFLWWVKNPIITGLIELSTCTVYKDRCQTNSFQHLAAFYFCSKIFTKNYESYFYFGNNISYRDSFIILSALRDCTEPNQLVDWWVMVCESLISYCCCFTNKFSRSSWEGRFFSYAFNLLSSGAQNRQKAIFNTKIFI